MNKYHEYRVRNKTRYRQKHYVKNGTRWTIEEIEMVLAHTMTDVELGKIIKRTPGAIQVKRVKLNKAKLLELEAEAEMENADNGTN